MTKINHNLPRGPQIDLANIGLDISSLAAGLQIGGHSTPSRVDIPSVFSAKAISNMVSDARWPTYQGTLRPEADGKMSLVSLEDPTVAFRLEALTAELKQELGAMKPGSVATFSGSIEHKQGQPRVLYATRGHVGPPDNRDHYYDGGSGGGDITTGEKKNIGQVSTREARPKITQIGVYHKDKATSRALQLLNKGFEADKAGNYKSAEKTYQAAFLALRDQAVKQLGPELTKAGIGQDWLAMNDNPAVFAWVAREGSFDAAPEIKNAYKMYLNRNGLAIKHEAGDPRADTSPDQRVKTYRDAMMFCTMALQVDPGYGPAHYNRACIALKGSEAGLSGFENAKDVALKELAEAIKDKGFGFKRLAREQDTDWNAMRMTSPPFRELAGLSAL